MSELEALDRQDEERQGEVDEGGPVEEQVNEREVQVSSEEEEESLGQQLISLEKFDLLKIHEASVYKSHLIIQNVEQLQMTREGRVVDLKKTVKADGVSGLRIMKKEALDLWGIRFSNMQKIEMGPTAAADDLSQTIMADDGVLERVGKKEEQPKEPSPPRVRSKRKMESCPLCVRSFTDKENLKEHMRSDHFDS